LGDHVGFVILAIPRPHRHVGPAPPFKQRPTHRFTRRHAAVARALMSSNGSSTGPSHGASRWLGRPWRAVLQLRCAAPWRASGQALLALLAGLGLAHVLAIDSHLGARLDAQVRRWAPLPPPDAAVVVDIDEASLRQLGGWPLSRSVYPVLADWLQGAGARVLALNLLLTDARADDATVADMLARNPLPLVMAARAITEGGVQQPAQLPPPGCTGWPVAGWQLPVWAQAGDGAAPALAINHVGAHSLPVDADGVLRHWPLWQQAGGLALPVLPLAVWQLMNPQAAAALRCQPSAATGGTALVAGGVAVWPLLARAEPAQATLPLWRLVDAAAGRLSAADSAELAERVRGRVVFLGSSAVPGDTVRTPQGSVPGTATLAAAYDALSHGQLLRPHRRAVDAALLAVGLLPWLAGLRRRRPRLLAELAWLALAGGALLLANEALMAGAAQPSHLGAPLAMLAAWATAVLLMAAARSADERRSLQAARARAEQAGRTKDEVLAHVGHEIRTPLNALLGAADLLAASSLDSAQARHVGLFRGAGQELLQMLNDLLDLSKIEAGLLTMQRLPFSLSRLVAAQVMLFEARAQQKGLQLRVEVLPDLPEVVVGDSLRLAQVLRNLLSNAVKFTSVGSVTLAVGRAADGQQIRFEVRDTGIGVPGDRVEAIFAPYTQGAADTTQRFGGTGLGLTIARRLVQAMGGRIGLSSREGLGSTFHVDMPLPATAATPRDEPAFDLFRQPAPRPRHSTRLPAWRVLLVDDSPLNILLAQAYLDGMGHRIDVVHDGAAAVRRFDAERHDVVLMDLQMPVLGGLDAARQMRAIEALTGQVEVDHVAQALEAGFNVHLGKPVSREQLLAVLARHAGTPAGRGDGSGGSSSGGGSTASGGAARAAGRASVPAADGWQASSSGTATTVSGVPPTVPSSPRLWALSQLPDADLGQALDRLGSEALYGRVLDAAGQALQQFERRLSQALDAVPCDLGRAQRLAHDLKSVAATLGLNGLAADAQALESALDTAVTPTEDAAVTAARRTVAARLAALEGALAQSLEPGGSAAGAATRP